MNRSCLLTARVVFGWSILSVSVSAAQELSCPAMPDKITQVNRDVQSDVKVSVGSLGKLKAGEVGVKTDVVAKNLFEKYPNTDRIMVVQMMAATYCALLRDSKTVKDSEKLRLWSEFTDRVFKFENPNYNPTPRQTPKPKREATPAPKGPAPTNSGNPKRTEELTTGKDNSVPAVAQNPALQHWLTESKASPPERVEFRASGISMPLILVSGSYFGDQLPVKIAPYYISTKYIPKQLLREHAMKAAVQSAAPPPSEDNRPICEVYLSDAKDLVEELGVHLVTDTQWINAFEGKFIDPQGQVELIYGREGNDDYLAEVVIDPPMANTYYSDKVAVHRFFGKAKGCMRIAISLDELRKIGFISTRPSVNHGTETELYGGQQGLPSVLSDTFKAHDSLATEVRRAKPTIEFEFPTSGDRKQKFHVHDVRPNLIQIEPKPTGVKEDDLPMDVPIVGGTVTILKFGQEDEGGYIMLDTTQVPIGARIRGEIIDYIEVKKSR